MNAELIPVCVLAFNGFINQIEKIKIVFVANDVSFERKIVCYIGDAIAASALDFHDITRLPIWSNQKKMAESGGPDPQAHTGPNRLAICASTPAGSLSLVE